MIDTIAQAILQNMRCIVPKICFYVSGAAQRLIALFKKDSKILQSTALIVFDNPPLSLLNQYAKNKNIELLEIDYKKLGLNLKERNIYLSNTLLNAMQRLDITHCFCFGRLLLVGELLKIYQNKIINFHPSILPLFSGNKAIDKALENKAFLLGNTAHFVDDGIDSGPIIMQSIIKSSEFRDYEDVLSLQIPMIEYIYNNIDSISIKNNIVSIKDSTSHPAFFPSILHNNTKEKKAIFIGNRLDVLDEILQSNIRLEKILILKDSYAHKNIKLENFILFDTKEMLLNEIKNCNFDILISNGCPFILPVSSLKKPNQKFINIHPSLLPSLRGKHPINGAILFNKKAGASVHMMNDEVDKGEILSQVEIPLKNLSLALLYKLSFKAEAMAFKIALQNDFKATNKIKIYKESYYSRPKDIKIHINSNNKKLIRTINAFGIENIAATIITKIGEFKVLEIKKIKNKFLKKISPHYKEYEILETYEDKILFLKNDEFLELRFLNRKDISKLKSKMILWGGGILDEILQIFSFLPNKKAYFGGNYALS